MTKAEVAAAHDNLKGASEEAFMWVMTAPLLLFKDSVLFSTESDNLIKNPTII
jgi:hypothetical protein